MIEIEQWDTAYSSAFKVNAFEGETPYLAGYIVFCRHAKRWEYRSDNEVYFTADDLIEIANQINDLNAELSNAA